MRYVKRISQWLLGWKFPALPVLIGVFLTSPSILGGIQADDYFIRNTAVGAQPANVFDLSPLETYSYLSGVPADNLRIMDHGFMPWWTDPHCRTTFGRPLTSLTQVVDFRLWPNHPVIMHVHSLMWFGLLIWAASRLYRRLSLHPNAASPLWAAGLASLMFAVDDAHAIPAGWLANRNALIAGVFGVLALTMHDRWRRDGWRAGMWLGPASFLLALLAKEEAASTAGYLLAYAVFLDPARTGQKAGMGRRLLSLLPYVGVGLLWVVGYHALGYGAYASGGYIDPLHNPLRFVARLVENGPILLLGQWAFPPADLRPLEAHWLFRVHWWFAIAALLLIARLLWPLLKKDAVARFWALGMLLSVVPISAIFTSDRLLLFVGLGAAGLLGSCLACVSEGICWEQRSVRTKRVCRVATVGVVGLHLVLAPLVLPLQSIGMRFVGGALTKLFDTLPQGSDVEQQSFVFANTFAAVADGAWLQARISRKEPRPIRSLNLNASCSRASMTRLDEYTLVVSPEGGYLKPHGHRASPGDPALSVRYLVRHLDTLVRAPEHPLRSGERIELTLATIEITKTTPDGRPAEATFRFHVPLEDPSLRWLYANLQGYAPFTLPAIGETVSVPSPLEPSTPIKMPDDGR